jgi:hypothetical protein
MYKYNNQTVRRNMGEHETIRNVFIYSLEIISNLKHYLLKIQKSHQKDQRDRLELNLQHQPWGRRDMRQLWLDKDEKTSNNFNFKIYF